ncbi:MAG UNVERIFIED_CONTAM: hypothetical protein LVQ98_01160 [Rickettsiaceae bacterium]
MDKIESINLKTRYIERIIEDIEIDPLLRIVWDLGNGAACSLVPDLVKKLPNENILIHHEIDGNFHHAPPTLRTI